MIKNDFNQPKGSTIGVLKDGRTVQQAIDAIDKSLAVRLSSKLAQSSGDAKVALDLCYGVAAATSKVVLIDVDCQLSTTTIPTGLEVRIAHGVTVSKIQSSTSAMFNMGNFTSLIGEGSTATIDGSSANSMCALAVGVSNVLLLNLVIRNFKLNGAMFDNCVDTEMRRCNVREIRGGAQEYSCGQYVTNCIRHLSVDNVITGVDANGIKFRANSLGLTDGCMSLNDTVRSAGFIGIANGTCKNHLVSGARVFDCVDNGLDMNGCYNAEFNTSLAVRCQDGFYMGENNIDFCRILNCAAEGCKRSGIGSLGSLTNCKVANVDINNCGSGVYCSGFVGLKLIGLSITNSTKRQYLDNETGISKTSSGVGIDLQSELSGCYSPKISGCTFHNNEGPAVRLGASGTIGGLSMSDNMFTQSIGGKVSYGGTLVDAMFVNNAGYITDRVYSLQVTGDGVKTDFTVALPEAVLDTSYTINGVVPDWLTTFRVLPGTKTTTLFGISFGTAPPSGSRTLVLSLGRLRPV
ncbi:tail fiber [Klebsiella phage vB_Kp_IME531]|uniref:Probable tail spike protein n=1 Tax=Klebsiella phage vB_Kp_IME531 TaxID=2880891 RepID=A0AAE8YDT5_9CAUD|nr:tail fiber [Klebsiella phage vB_Kp_IME531]